MKVWERRLMKDFQVAVPLSLDEDQMESFQQPNEEEDNITKWKRIAKLAVLQSANHRWNQVKISYRDFKINYEIDIFICYPRRK